MSQLFLIATIIALLGLAVSVFELFQRSSPSSPVSETLPTPSGSSARAVPPTPSLVPSPTSTIPPVALVAGHSGGIDPGAICPDGLREVDVTTEVAQRTKALLTGWGYRVEILAEFDPRLNAAKRDYAPRAFVSIHADSCIYYATGFKTARAAFSATPQEDDRLVRCLTRDYGAATQLPFHSGSITVDMTQYHGLNEISPTSPAAIIELGFLGSDHDLLKNHRDVLAQGVAGAIRDFLRGDECK